MDIYPEDLGPGNRAQLLRFRLGMHGGDIGSILGLMSAYGDTDATGLSARAAANRFVLRNSGFSAFLGTCGAFTLGAFASSDWSAAFHWGFAGGGTGCVLGVVAGYVRRDRILRQGITPLELTALSNGREPLMRDFL